VLKRLYEAVIAPAIRTAAMQGTTRLLVVPHEALTYLPFSALVDPLTSRRLVESFTIQHLPSAAVLPSLRSGTEGAALVAVTDGASRVFAPFPGQLPASLEEASAVEAALDGARIVLGAEASEANLRRALEAGGIVHVATHGVMNPRNPMSSRIELAKPRETTPGDDGQLEVRELLLLDVAAPLVFLSGCETGLGPAWSSHYTRGEDFATLAQAFLYAGAGNVVASLWRLEDAGAARFAEMFYDELRDAPPVEALAAAQRRMMQDNRFGSPYHWAAYRLSGPGP
jgi:CHAT domain-containing protein